MFSIEIEQQQQSTNSNEPFLIKRKGKWFCRFIKIISIMFD